MTDLQVNILVGLVTGLVSGIASGLYTGLILARASRFATAKQSALLRVQQFAFSSDSDGSTSVANKGLTNLLYYSAAEFESLRHRKAARIMKELLDEMLQVANDLHAQRLPIQAYNEAAGEWQRRCQKMKPDLVRILFTGSV